MVSPYSDKISRVPPYSKIKLFFTYTGLSPTMVLGWCWGGLGMVLGWSWGGLVVVLEWSWGGLGVVLGWSWGGLWGGLGVVLVTFSPLSFVPGMQWLVQFLCHYIVIL